ncbi:MAG: hypothetical protein F4166_04505 [Gammaproteobacteria bacterium]|nr:hypothetical protein [Gammaproteobacteria bacterium]
MNKTFGYARVSTPKQTTDPQLELSHQAGCDEIFVDTVVIVKLDRFSRSITDLLSIVKEIESKGALLCSLSALVQLILKKCLASIAI